MKKIISAILLLAICVGCFVGCAPKEDANLNAAAEYLYTMYKDGKTTTDSDYTVVGQVRINDVVYPITWTSDKPENVEAVSGENNMTTIKITATEEEVSYKLTATMKNEDGLEVSVSFDRIIPAKAQVGGTIVLAYPKENKFITGSHYLYTGKNKWQLNLTENEAEAIALEVVDNGDNTVTFKAGEYFLFCDATHVQFVKEQSDNTKFVLEAADTEGGYFIKCAVANYGGKAQYLEVYSGYLTCYGMGTDPSIYVFKLQETTTAAGTVSGLDEAPAPEDTTPPATNNDPAADSALSISDAITLGASKAHNTYTEGKYYITGTVKEIKSDVYGNMIIVDEAGKEILVYGTYDADGTNRYDAMSKKPVAGDKVTVYGILGQYNDTPQMKNGWITAHTAASGSSSNSGSNTGSNSGSNTGSNSGSSTNPPATSTKVVFGFPKDNKFVTGKHYLYTSSKGKQKFELELSDNKADALVMEKIDNGDGTVTFKAGEYFLFCDGTHVKFVSAQGENTKFVLEKVNGGCYIKCATANYEGNPQYLEVYSGYLTCFNMSGDAGLFVFTLEENVSGANGAISHLDGSNAGGSSSSGSGSSSGNTGSTDTPTEVNGKKAASIDLTGTTTRTSYSTTQIVHAANGITYTNDKGSSTNNFYDMTGKTYATRAYKGSTVKIEYTGMVAIVLHLDDYAQSDGTTYMGGFDGMTVSGATITCNGATVTINFAAPTNVFQSAEMASQTRIKSIDVYTAN